MAHQVLEQGCSLWRGAQGPFRCPFKGHNPSTSSPEWKVAMGAIRISHCIVRASSSPPGMQNLRILNQKPQGTRLRDSCKQPLLLPHMGSQQLHCLWLQKLSLFTFVLKLHPAHTRSVSETQNTILPQPAQLCSTWLPAATLHSCRSCKNRNTCHQLKHSPPVRQEFPLGCCFTCTGLLSPQDPART